MTEQAKSGWYPGKFLKQAVKRKSSKDKESVPQAPFVQYEEKALDHTQALTGITTDDCTEEESNLSIKISKIYKGFTFSKPMIKVTTCLFYFLSFILKYNYIAIFFVVYNWPKFKDVLF